MQTFFTLRFSKAIYVGLVLLVAPTMPIALYSWDHDAGAAYAEKYWDNYNPDYYDWTSEGGDCANFVSQCLMEAGVDLSDGPDYVTKEGKKLSITTCTGLNTNLRESQSITPTTITWPSTDYPDWLGKGCVIIFGDITGDYYKHAVYVVSGTGADALSDAHDTDVHQGGITHWYGTGAGEWERATFYCK